MSDTTEKTIKGAFVGTVVSDKMDKTRVVEVKTRKRHAKYKKIYTVNRRFVVHDEGNAYHVGDVVTFLPSRPYSKNKKFVIISKG
jgi:small subunit ribosomal protein S17